MIRKAVSEDIPRILEIFSFAKEKMREEGNPDQWGASYPALSDIADDISRGELFLIEEEGTVHAVFMASGRKDPVYEKNKHLWPDEEYHVIHRVASDGKIKGVLSRAVDFVIDQAVSIRMDTYKDNKVMQKALVRNGFSYQGTYYDGGMQFLAYYRKGRRP